MELFENYLVICMENSGDDFIRTWHRIMDLECGNGKGLFEDDTLDWYYYECGQPVKTGGYGKVISDIRNAFDKQQMRVFTEQMTGQIQDYGICLWIRDCAANDTIEYEYLALMLQNMSNVICYIYPDREERSYIYKNISCFFSFFAQDRRIRTRIWIERRKTGNSGIEMPGTVVAEGSRKIIPVIAFEYGNGDSALKSWVRTYGEFLACCAADGAVSGAASRITSEQASDMVSDVESGIVSDTVSDTVSGIVSDTVSGIVSDTVSDMVSDTESDIVSDIVSYEEMQEQLKRFDQQIRRADEKKLIQKADDLRRRRQKLVRKQNEISGLCRKSADCRLLYRCIGYFTGTPDSRSIRCIRQYTDFFWSRDVQEMLKEMPLLAFYMLCIQLYFLKGKNELQLEEIKLAIVNAGELTEGVIQLLENLHHSSEKRGFLSIRIHERKKNDGYLCRNYPKYWQQNLSKYHYEFRILDYSTVSISESFQKRHGEKNSRKFAVRDFFEYTDDTGFWNTYHKVPENIVHHYGLQIFSTIISNNDGYFHVVSSSGRKIDQQYEFYSNQTEPAADIRAHIPGTEYIVLLPMQRKTVPINPSVDPDIQYQFDLKNKYCLVRQDLNRVYAESCYPKDRGYEEQEQKEYRINSVRDSILEALEREMEKHKAGKKPDADADPEGERQEDGQHSEIVLLLSAKNWGERKTEIFCKSLMLCLMEWKPENGQGFYTIIQDCTANDFIAITRMFAVFYGKSMLCGIEDLSRLQVYLSGEDQSEEFLIVGKDIAGLLTMAGKLTLVRGIQPHCLRSVEYILSKFQTKKEWDTADGQSLKLVPFDILEIPDSSETLFERAVKKVLESNLQKYSFGCKLEHTHMRIGSKLHIKEFYEAELLFHNNYYVARFAQLIIRRLERTTVLEKGSPVMFVGYETYSELLLYEIMTHLNEKGYQSSYMIYEQRRDAKFRYYDSMEYILSKEEVRFILIVPINSSMTTHSKLRASLIAEMEKIRPGLQTQIAANYALILIRSREENEPCDRMEEKYCESMKNGIIRALYLPPAERKIRYFVCVKTEWTPPLECKLCFPDRSMLDEKPLIETNRESIIPIQMLGIQESDILQEDAGERAEDSSVRDENEERVRRLGECLIYRHIVRNGKHFMFYFQLEKYFMQNREHIIRWLNKLNRQKKKSKGLVYDVIVAPLHFSNAGFVAEVNYHLYGNAALVLNFEVEKEFRENVRTKYSNIIGLYKKLIDMKKEAELRFHFVDDNIITGNTFFRAKSLFASLLPEHLGKEGNVRIKVFEDIIVILNRMSEASIMNYIPDRKDYHAYVSLNISSMRNHEDACTLCKTVESARQLRDRSSTNIMYQFFDKRIVRHQMIEAEEYRYEKRGQNHTVLQERACRRMLCTHIMNERLAKLGYLKNSTKEVTKVMQDLLRERTEGDRVQDEAMEWMISYIKIFSRPFVSFRKSNREAAFQIMLEITEFIVIELVQTDARLEQKRFTNYKGLDAVCRTIRDARLKWKQDEKIFSLLLTLMQRLSALGSNYIIRRRNIEKLFAVVSKLNIGQEMREEFKKRYLSIAKRITCLTSGESKCVYLEYLLLYGEEYLDEETEERMQKRKRASCFGLTREKQFLEILFLENTRVLYDGIRDLAGEIDEQITEDELLNLIVSKYYYDNFVRFLLYYGFLVFTETGKKFQQGKYQAIVTLVKLYRMLSADDQTRQDRDVERFYNDLLEFVEIITGAKTVRLLFFYDMSKEQEKIRKKVYKKQRGMEVSLEKTEYVSAPFLYDTYSVNHEEETRVLIKYRNYTGEGYSAKNRNQMDEVYLELVFSAGITEMERMIALKCVMLFRNLIVENLEKHFSNNLMQKWSAEQIFKKNMKLERSSDHTDKDDLEKNLKMITEGMGQWNQEQRNQEQWNQEHQKALFYLVINSYIARINVQLLADALPEGENEEYVFAYVYKYQLKALIDCMHQFEKFQIIDENGDEIFSKSVLRAGIRMYQDPHRRERLSVKRLSIIITELIHSAVRYSDDQKVYIYRKKNYLVVRNSFISDKCIHVIQQEAQDAYSRKKEGISLAVIKELVDKFYRLEEPDDVIIDAREEKGKKFYYVKLPILVDRKEPAGDE